MQYPDLEYINALLPQKVRLRPLGVPKYDDWRDDPVYLEAWYHPDPDASRGAPGAEWIASVQMHGTAGGHDHKVPPAQLATLLEAVRCWNRYRTKHDVYHLKENNAPPSP